MSPIDETPSWGLRGAFIQSFLASFRLRRVLADRRVPSLEANTEAHILETDDGARLQAHFTRPAHLPSREQTVVLLHGWEGSHRSIYLHSLACALHENGWPVVRLNLRDHGDTHHLNEEPFHSARLGEVLSALQRIHRLQNQAIAVVGFSLGGNFALRVAIDGPDFGLPLTQVIAINPAVDPRATTEALDAEHAYRPYFRRKWNKTLQARRAAWPDGPDYADLTGRHSMLTITDRFARNHAGFDSIEDYFSHYTLGPERFRNLRTPTVIVSARDDALVPISDIENLQGASSSLEVLMPRYGGHCGYVKDWALRSWLNPWITQRLETATRAHVTA